MAVVLKLLQTQQIRINIHKRNDTKNTVQTIRSTVHTNTHITKTHITKPTHTHTHALQNKIKQPQYKIHPNEIVTIKSSTLSLSHPNIHGTFVPRIRYIDNNTLLACLVSQVHRTLVIWAAT